MNKNVLYTTQFKKDFKLCIKRGYNMQQIKSIMKLLESGKQLPEKNKDHNLTGNYFKCRECHMQSFNNCLSANTHFFHNSVLILALFISLTKNKAALFSNNVIYFFFKNYPTYSQYLNSKNCHAYRSFE